MSSTKADFNDRRRLEAFDDQEQQRVHSSRGKIVDLEVIGQLRDNAIVHVVKKMPGGGKKKGPRKSSQSDRGAHDKSSSEADVIVGLMEKDCRIGRRGWNEGVVGKMLELDDDETQDMMRRLRSSIQVSVGTDPKLALEGFKRRLHERKQAMKTQQEEATRVTEQQRRRQEVIARESERERQKQDEAEKEMERQTARSEMKVGFGRYKGRTCKSTCKEDGNHCE